MATEMKAIARQIAAEAPKDPELREIRSRIGSELGASGLFGGDLLRALNQHPEAIAAYKAAFSRCATRIVADPAVREAIADHFTIVSSKAWADPEQRTARCNSMKAANAKPEIRAKRSAALKQFCSDPERLARRNEVQSKNWQDPEIRARRSAERSAAAKARWGNPEFRERQLRRMRDPSLHAKRSEIAKASTSKPEYRAKQGEAMKARWADPAYQAKQSADATARWADPEYRARQLIRRKRHIVEVA